MRRLVRLAAAAALALGKSKPIRNTGFCCRCDSATIIHALANRAAANGPGAQSGCGPALI